VHRTGGIRGLRVTRSALAALSAAALSLGITSTAAAALPSPFFGVTSAEQPTTADLQTMAQAKVGLVRFTLDWPNVQSTRAGALDWSKVDAVVAGAASNGLDLLPVLYGTPPWAADCGIGAPGGCETISPMRSSEGAAGWRQFVAEAVRRYGPNGTFWSDPSDAFNPPPRPIRRWQIWNEANSVDFFGPRPSPSEYAHLTTAASEAIRSVDPGARIYLAGLFGTPPKPGISAWKFLDRLYSIKDFRSEFDRVALHPYSPGLRGITYQLDRALKVMRAHKAGGTKIAITEIGWSSAPAHGGSLFKGLKGQGQALKSSFGQLLRDRKRYNLDSLFWFSWRDPTPGTTGACLFCASTGLLRFNLSPKPSLSAYTRFTGGRP
jgi:hypothetical protein